MSKTLQAKNKKKSQTASTRQPRAKVSIKPATTDRQLRDSSARLAGIVHSTMDAIIALDADQQIVLFNAAAEKMFGCAAAEVIGQSIDRFIPERFHTLHHEYVEQFGRTGLTNRSMGHLTSLSAVRATGEEFPVEAAISRVEAAGDKLYTVILRDMTERQRFENTLQQQTQLLKFLHTIAIDIGTQLKMPLLLQRAMAQAAELLQADRGGEIFLYDVDQKNLRLAEGSGLNADRSGLTIDSGAGIADKVFQTARPLIIDNYSTTANSSSAALGLPLLLDGQVIGVLNLFADARHRTFNQTDIDLAEMFAAQLVVAIRNAQLHAQAEREIVERQRAEDKLQRQNRVLSGLYENMLDVLQFQELDQLLQLIVVRAAELLEAPYSEIALLAGNEMIVRAALPNQAFLVGARVQRTEARLSWQAVDTRQPAILTDYATWSYRRPIYDQTLTHAVAVFPILKGDQCLGVLDLSRDQAGHVFSTEQIQTGQLFARLAALAIDNDQAYAQLLIELEARKRAEEAAQRQAQELALLSQVRTALASEIELTDLFRVTVEAIAKILGHKQVSLYLIRGQSLHLQHQVGFENLLAEIPIELGITGRCVRTGQTIFLPDVNSDPDFIGFIDDLTSEICVPLFDQQQVVGVLNVESQHGLVLTQADANLMQALGEQVNIAIGRARLYSELRESERRYKELVDNAREIIYRADAGGFFIFVSPAAAQIIGYTEAELLGRHYLELIPAAQRFAALRFYRRQVETRTPVTYYEFPVIVKDGSMIWIGQNVQLLTDPTTSQVIGTQAVARDITDLKRAEAALRKHALELDARNAELNTFAHTVAHDLNNPIGVIMGFSELLLDSNNVLTEEQLHESLHSILNSSRKMSTIIEELMLLAGLRQQEVLPEPIEMGVIIDEALERLALSIKEAAAHISLSVSAEWPIAFGYAPWIEEVWVNYLSNAIKYGGQPPHIELGATRQANATIRFWVRDNGDGLTTDEQSRLFTPFTRLQQIRVKGHGLGLSIVKRIIEKLDGTVGVDSEVGRGSTFYFTLPIAPQAH